MIPTKEKKQEGKDFGKRKRKGTISGGYSPWI